MEFCSDPVLDAIAHRRSVSKVGSLAPSQDQLLELLPAVTHVADHKALRPWRLLTIRGAKRLELGLALDAAAGLVRPAGEVNVKPLRAELLIAIVSSPKAHDLVPTWEQEATAAGAAHLLELALWQAGWGVMWRTGKYIDCEPVRAFHRLEAHERVLGWLYVGDIDPGYLRRLRTSNRTALDPKPFISALE